MKAAEWGRIVNVSTTSTATASPMLHVYNMTKAAVVSMSHANAKEFAKFGIAVNVLSPGVIMVNGGDWGEVMNRYFAEAGLDRTNPYDVIKLGKSKFGGGDGETAWLGRAGLVDEYGAAIVWLGSKANSYMTGTNINVDGGTDF